MKQCVRREKPKKWAGRGIGRATTKEGNQKEGATVLLKKKQARTSPLSKVLKWFIGVWVGVVEGKTGCIKGPVRHSFFGKG